jgi:hypothetical protein
MDRKRIDAQRQGTMRSFGISLLLPSLDQRGMN